MLPYGGKSDRFDEINEIVNDPMKARLLDGLKRASKNHSEMSLMLRSLRRLVQRGKNDKVKYTIYEAPVTIAANIPIEQLRASVLSKPNFQDEELTRLFRLLFQPGEHDYSDRSMLEKSFPPSLPNRDHLIDLLISIYGDKGASEGCKQVVQTILGLVRSFGEGEQFVAQDVCLMRKIAGLSDGLFEEFLELNEDEQYVLNKSLAKGNLPIFK